MLVVIPHEFELKRMNLPIFQIFVAFNTRKQQKTLRKHLIISQRILGFLCFLNFEQSTSREFSGLTEKYFKKLREGIFKHISNNIDLFHFSQRCYKLGDSGMSFSYIFRMHNFPVLYMFLEYRFWTPGDGFKNNKRFFIQDIMIYKNLLHFCNIYQGQGDKSSSLNPMF